MKQKNDKKARTAPALDISKFFLSNKKRYAEAPIRPSIKTEIPSNMLYF